MCVLFKETISIPHFTAEGVSAVTKWALLALISYWLLFFLLRVTVALVRRVFWLIKAVVVLWLFVRIVSDPVAPTEVTTMRLILLVLICAVFGVATSYGGGGLESRISKLEGQVKGMEKKKKEWWAAQTYGYGLMITEGWGLRDDILSVLCNSKQP